MSDERANATDRCPQCGAEFEPGTSPLGLCPACLMKLGVSDPALKVPELEAPRLAAPVATADPVVTAPVAPRQQRSLGMWLVAGAAVIVMMIAFVLFRTTGAGSPASTTNVIRFELALPRDLELVEGAQFAISPDGRHIVAAARERGGQPRLWIRPLQSMDWRELARTDGAAFPFWSPDSRHIGFFADRKLRRIDVSNGLVETLCNAPQPRGGTWGRAEVIVFASSGGLFSLPESGGTPAQLTRPDHGRGERSHGWPRFLPDGRGVLFVSTMAGKESTSTSELSVLSTDTGSRRSIVTGAGAGAFAGGTLLFERHNALFAIRFDPDRAEVRGEPQQISGAEQIGPTATASGPGFSVSDTGVLVHAASVRRLSQLMWLDRTGRALQPVGEPAEYQGASLSPDGRRLAAARRDGPDGPSRIWIVDLERNTTSRLTMSGAGQRHPIWSPDGSRIVFVEGETDLHVVDVTTLSDEAVLKTAEVKRPTDWSPDARMLLYSAESTDGGSSLHALPLGGDRKPIAASRPSPTESDGRFSPDGRWIAYVSNETGNDEVYIRSFQEPGGRWQVTSEGGTRPRWRRDGRELYFISRSGLLSAVEVRPGQVPSLGAPMPIFSMGQSIDYEVIDGHRFIVTMPAQESARAPIMAVLHWSAELRRESGR